MIIGEMPFKTRKQKEAAGKRRFAFDFESSSIRYRTESEAQEPSEKVIKSHRKSETENFSFVFGEITRIGLLAFSLIAIQLIVRIFLGPNPLNFLFK